MNVLTVLFISFLLISILGTLLHFTHDAFKKSIFVHIVSAVNESTWEHMKLLIFPTVLVLIFQYLTLRSLYSNIFNGILVLIIIEILFIPISFESLKKLMKKVPLWLTILIFYLAVLLGILGEYYILVNSISFLNENISLLLISILCIHFGLFTFKPPKKYIFKDPVTGKYGDVK